MDSEDCLNIFEQRPSWARLTTNLAWCFTLPETADVPVIINTLQNALESLTNSSPWLAGQVINEHSDPANKNTGVFKIVPRDSAPQVIIKDHRETPSVPSIQVLRESGFATRLFDEDTFAPRPTLVLTPGIERPVLLVQANIISGGLIVVFGGNHSAMDMPGQAQIIRWFDKACRNEVPTPAELETGNMQRGNLIPLLDSSYQPGDELWQQTPPTPAVSMAQDKTKIEAEQAQPHWATFFFPSTSVADLKIEATTTRTSEYVSTDDTLSAFLWQSLSRARLHRLGPDTVSTSSRACNVRQVLDIPSTYPGLVQNNIIQQALAR